MDFALYGTLSIVAAGVAWWFFELLWAASNGKLDAQKVVDPSEVLATLAFSLLAFIAPTVLALWSFQQAWRAF